MTSIMGLPRGDWQVNMNKVAERSTHLLESGLWSDCKFIVGQDTHQEVVEGHKIFLAMSSPVFEAMFFGGMAEKNDPIPIKDVQPKAFKALLQYIYTDNVELGSFELACELCYCAKKYMLPFLVHKCTNFMWSDLSPKKACRAYEFAKLFEEPGLLNKCLDIIWNRTDEVLKESTWEEIELATLITVLEQENLQISSEAELFEAVERWAKSECIRKCLDPTDSKLLRSVVGNALKKIRFLTLTPQQFAEGPARSPLLLQEEAFAILMNISSSDNKFPMPEGFSCSKQSRIAKPVISNLDRSQTLCRSMNFDITEWSITAPNATNNFMNLEFDDDQPLPTDALPVSTNIPTEETRSNDMHPLSLSPPFTSIGSKFYCTRSAFDETDCFNHDTLDCSVTFTVDKNICVNGIMVPTQINNRVLQDFVETLPSLPTQQSYTEVVYAHLLDSYGSRLTYTYFTKKVNTGQLMEISFNRPVFIQKMKTYRVEVVFNKPGIYPSARCTRSKLCDTVYFSFNVGKRADNIRDGLIRSIVFTHH